MLSWQCWIDRVVFREMKRKENEEIECVWIKNLKFTSSVWLTSRREDLALGQGLIWCEICRKTKLAE